MMLLLLGPVMQPLPLPILPKENGAKKVLVLEKANKKERGGNTFFSGGLFRIAFDDPHELKAMVPNAGDIIPGFYEDVLPYTKEDMWSDLWRYSQ